MKHFIVSVLLIIEIAFFSIASPRDALAFNAGGCDGDCKKCHSLTKEEVGGILKKLNAPDAKILDIKLSPVKSLWEINIDAKGKRELFYVDFSKKHVVTGQIIEVGSGSNKTQESYEKLQPKKKVDVSKIPLKNALVMGDTKAPKKVIVFTDPD